MDKREVRRWIQVGGSLVVDMAPKQWASTEIPRCVLASDHDALVSALEAELAAVRKDAERYRYLRRGPAFHNPPEPLEVMHWLDSGPEHCDGEQLDRCVDVAIAATATTIAPSGESER